MEGRPLIPSPPGSVRPAQPRAGRWSANWLWGLSCGCLLAFVFGIGATFFAAWTFVHSIDPCVPSDFPDYPRSFFWNYGVTGVGECRVSWTTFNGSATILDFFEARLSEGHGSWAITATHRDISRIDFKHVQGQTMTGVVWVVDQAGTRNICVSFHKQSGMQTASYAERGGRSSRSVCTYSPPQPVPRTA